MSSREYSSWTGVVRLLLATGCDIDQPTDRGRTPLHLAVWNNAPAVVILLFRAGCKVDIPDDRGETPLMLCALTGHDLIMNILLSYGADIKLKNRDGNTALHCAAKNGHHGCAIQLAMEEGQKLDQPNMWQHTPLLLATMHGHTKVANLLIDAEADIHFQDRSGRTALHYAIKNGLSSVVKQLVIKGSLDVMDANNNTPLMEAVIIGDLPGLRLLIAANFNANVWGRCTSGGSYIWCTPLEAAVRMGRLDIADLLLMAGGNIGLKRFWGKEVDMPDELLSNETVMTWLHDALETPQPLMALCRRVIRQELGFWPQERIAKLPAPNPILKFLSYEST